MKYGPILIFFFAALSCTNKNDHKTSESQTTDTTAPTTDLSRYPELFQKIIMAHGGFEKWQQQASLNFTLETTLGKEKTETQLIDLWTRKVLIESDSFKLGMDGSNVWVFPSKEAFGELPARFYHNLIFYFFAIPHILADPGTIYEDLGERTIDNKSYRALKVSFEEGTGDADDDFYILHVNPETYQLEILLYTVTYFSGEQHENYSALVYEQWQDINGLVVPQKMVGRKYEDGSLGDVNYNNSFSGVMFSTKQPESGVFDMPSGAEIDSLKTN